LNSMVKNFLLWMVILVVIILAWNVFRGGAPGTRELTFSDFLDSVHAEKVDEVTIRGNEIHGMLKGAGAARPAEFKTYTPSYPDLVKELRQANVRIKAD
jgi:cell division protease FtsH